MHVPDGFLDAPTSVTTGVVAALAVGVSLRKARHELDDRTAPLAGLVAAFVFAVQMLNFPVGAGTSGHLMGGAIAAVLVGPWTGVLATSVVFLVQCLLFADGGVTALGTNILLMGVVTCGVGWLVFRGLQIVLPKTDLDGAGRCRHRGVRQRAGRGPGVRRPLRGRRQRRPLARQASPRRWSGCTP